MAGRFPGARTPAQLWANVAAGVESIRRVPLDELRRAGVPPSLLGDPAYVPAAAVLPGVDTFDAEFFGVSAGDADLLDPQHRHLVECAWEALEDAGYVPGRIGGRVGVYAGCGMSAYFMFNLLSHPELAEAVGLPRRLDGDKDALTARVSSLLGLAGPSLGIQTACSTSLVAVHVACQQLLNRECDLALAGGVTIELPHGVGYRYEEGEILSPDGHCRAFDADARGTVFGSGVGVVALRRIADAVTEGDHIYAVIKGSAVNNDGSAKVGYLAPSVDGQTAAVREAIAVSGVQPERIGYLEAHGTGTPVGDPIEVTALTQAFRGSTQRTGFCALGSIKTNIGHLDTAAGVAGLIKAVKALEHRQLPPSLHFSRPNPAIDFPSTPFTVNTTLRPWPRPAEGPRAAAVNSLGVGGTNAHVIVEEAPDLPAGEADASPQLLVLSARTPAALETLSLALAAHLETHPHLPLADVAFTLQTGRRGFPYRRALVAAGHAEAAAALRRPPEAAPHGPSPAVVFVFPGEGVASPAGLRELCDREPVFAEALGRCVDAVRAAGGPVRDFAAATSPDDRAGAAVQLFAAEYALAMLFTAWGVTSAAVVGSGAGELVAAHLAGILALADAVALAGRLAEIHPAASPQDHRALADFVASLELRRPSRPVVSPITADWGGADMATASYWSGHPRGGAGFDQAVRRAGRLDASLLLELGPAPSVAPASRRLSLAGETAASRDGGDRGFDTAAVRSALGGLWRAGADIDWAAVHRHHRRRRVSLPTYPFAPARHWIAARGPADPGVDSTTTPAGTTPAERAPLSA